MKQPPKPSKQHQQIDTAAIAVAILCAARKSVYHAMQGIEVYDVIRDARTFTGGMPVVAHPPCRGWSAKCRHQAKPEPGEMELGIWCCNQVKQWGGVLEQPAWSHLFVAAGLPTPMHRIDDLWTIQVEQYWWGFPTPKPTWLCFSHIDPVDIQLPFRLRVSGSLQVKFKQLSSRKRSMTTPKFAEWLVDVARKART